MGLRGTAIAVALLCLSSAISVLGRPQQNSLTAVPSASSQRSPGGAAAETSSSCSSYSCWLCMSGIRLPRLRLLASGSTAFKQERRFLKGSGGGKGGGGRSRGGSVGAGAVVGGGGGGGNGNATVAIIVSVSVAAVVILLVCLLLWWKLKRRKNPNWRLRDCFKRKKPALAKGDDGPEAAEHSVAVDGPRLDHAAKSRKQASFGHDMKTTNTST